MIKPAIVVVGYNRPNGIKRLLDSIVKANYDVSDIPLIVSIDESDRSNEVEKVAREFKWEHGSYKIRRFQERQGLQRHIIQCGDYSEKYGAVIILEDDLVVAEDFYTYTCMAHEKYSSDDRICGISLYSHQVNQFSHIPFIAMPNEMDVYLGDMVVTWGQSWTALQWKKFKTWYFEHKDKLPQFNPKMPKDISNWTRSWGKYFASYIVEKKVSYIYPYVSRTTCFADYGEHNKVKTALTFVQVPLMHGQPNQYRFGKYENLVHYDAFYERILESKQLICNIPGNEICMDLNQLKTDTLGKRYVVTSSKLSYKKIATFGISLRPISMNVIENIPGNEIYLYKLEEGTNFIRSWGRERNELKLDINRIRYEYRNMAWQILLYYAPREFVIRVKDKIQERKRKNK